MTTANAQITGVMALKNATNTADAFVGPPAFTSYEIESAAKITLKGRGSNLTLPALELTTPARVQLQASNGQCWEASYSSAIKNTTSQFKAKSD